MVEISVFSCPHCGGSAELCEGVGSRDTLEDVFYWDEDCAPFLQEYVSPAIFKKTMELIADGWKPAEEFGYVRHFCPICKTIESRFHFRLEKGGKSWFPTVVCRKCRSRLVPVSGNHPPGSLKRKKEEECTRYLRCPDCGKLIDIRNESKRE